MFGPIFYAIANTILGAIELLLSIRILLKFFGASTVAPFVSWVYETTQPLLTPFIGAFPSPRLEGYFVIEFSSLIALVFFAFIGYLIDSLFLYIKRFKNLKHSDLD